MFLTWIFGWDSRFVTTGGCFTIIVEEFFAYQNYVESPTLSSWRINPVGTITYCVTWCA